MKVYVDELPKSCKECPMCRSEKLKLQRKGRYVEAEQCVFGQYKYQTMDDEIDTCPLQSLADYDKQVRNEVMQEIKKQVIQSTCYDTEEEVRNVIYDLNASSVLEILDQLQGEDNGNQ